MAVKYSKLLIGALVPAWALVLCAVLCPGFARAAQGPVIEAKEWFVDLPRDIATDPDVKFEDLIDALAVEVRTGAARGADTWADVRLSICDLTLRLKPEGPAFARGQTAAMVFSVAGWQAPGGTVYPALPYGYIKYCDITLQHNSALREPGWHALSVRLMYHRQDRGWQWTAPNNGWYRYQSSVHYFDSGDWWQAEYGPPYDQSAPKTLQHFGTHAGGNLWLALAFKKCVGCDLSSLDMRNADLSGGDFTKARFAGTDLTGAALGGANFQGATFRGATLKGVTLDAQDLSGTDLSGAVLHNASARRIRLDGANLTGVDAFNTDFSGASFKDATLDNAVFIYCDMRDAVLDGAHMRSPEKPQQPAARLFGSYLQGASLRNAVLRGAGLDNTDLRGADLTGALVDTLLILHNIKTDEKTTCPDGEPGPCKW